MAPAEPVLKLDLLGPLEVRYRDQPVPLPTSACRWLLVRLAVAPEGLDRDELARTLWPERPQPAASTNLRQTIARLRRALPDADAVLDVTRRSVAIRSGQVATDADRAAMLLASPWDAQAPDRLRSAVALYRGEVCAGLYVPHSAPAEEWLSTMREEWREHIGLALHHLGAVCDALGDHAGAHEVATRLLEMDPWSEDAHEWVVRDLAAAGDRVAAARHFAGYRDALGRDLGMVPGHRIGQLYEAVVRGEPISDGRPSLGSVAPGASLPRTRPATEAADGLFVGRDLEVGRLQSAWATARSGRGVVALVTGEAGIGKTGLLNEACRRFAEATVLRGECDEDAAAAYAPFQQILALDSARRNPGPMSRLTTRDRAMLAVMVPGGAFGAPRVPESLSGSDGRPDLFRAVSDYLVRLATQRPLALVVDDLHWAEPSTLALLRHVARACASSRVLLVVGYRESDLDDVGRSTVGELRRVSRVVEVPLDGLRVSALTDLARAYAVPDPHTVSRRLHERTGGNPFFVRQLLRANRLGAATDHDDDVPVAVLDVVRARMGRLPPRTREALDAAAVLGSRFDVATVASLMQLTPAGALDALGPAEQLGLVSATSPSSFGFVHGLVRDAQITALDTATRARLHADAALALLEPDASAGATAADVVRHLVGAGPLVPAEIVVAGCTRAGDEARRALAFDEATRFYQQALDGLAVLERVNGDRDKQRCDLLIALGSVRRRIGDPAHRQILLQAVTLAQQRGDARRMADAIVTVAPAGWGTRFQRPDPSIADLTSRALSLLPSSEPARRARLMSLLAADATTTTVDDEALRRSATALELAHSSGDPATVAFVLPRHFWTTYDPDRLDTRQALTDQMVSVARDINDLEMELYARACRFDVRLEGLEVDAAMTDLEILDDRAPLLRQGFYSWLALEKRSGLAVLRGSYDNAERLGLQAMSMNEASPVPAAVPVRVAQQAIVAMERGGAETVIPMVSAIIDETPNVPAWRLLRAALSSAGGQLDDARAEIDDVLRDDAGRVPRNNVWRSGLHCAASAVVEIGDRARAIELYELLRPSSGHLDWFGGASFGPSDLVLGRLAALLGDPRARGHLEAAVVQCRRLGARAYLAQSLLALADLDPCAPSAVDSRAEGLRLARDIGLAQSVTRG